MTTVDVTDLWAINLIDLWEYIYRDNSSARTWCCYIPSISGRIKSLFPNKSDELNQMIEDCHKK